MQYLIINCHCEARVKKINLVLQNTFSAFYYMIYSAMKISFDIFF